MIYSAQMHWKGIQRELKGWLWLLGREKCFIMETATVPLKPNSLTKADFKLIQFFQFFFLLNLINHIKLSSIIVNNIQFRKCPVNMFK